MSCSGSLWFSFPFVSAAVIGLLLGLLAVKKTSKKASLRRASLTTENPSVVEGTDFAPSFSLNFLSIFVHISDSIRPRSRWHEHHWKDLFLLHKSIIDDANFSQKWWRQKWKKGEGSSRPVMAGLEVNGLRKWKKLTHVPRFPTSRPYTKSNGNKTQMFFVCEAVRCLLSHVIVEAAIADSFPRILLVPNVALYYMK